MTPNDFKSSKFKLGRFANYFYVAAAFFNAIVFAVEVSPFFFPVTAETFNFVSPEYGCILRERTDLISFSSLFEPQAGVILGAITIFAILSWWFIPAESWLPREQVMRALNTSDEEPIGSI